MPTVMSPSSTGPLSPVTPGAGAPGAGSPGPDQADNPAESRPAGRGGGPAVSQLAVLGRPRRARRSRRARARWLGARQALSFAMGIASIFDLTGTTVYRTMRSVLPAAPPRPDDGSDPFRAAMGTILSAHHDALASSEDENGAALAG